MSKDAALILYRPDRMGEPHGHRHGVDLHVKEAVGAQCTGAGLLVNYDCGATSAAASLVEVASPSLQTSYAYATWQAMYSTAEGWPHEPAQVVGCRSVFAGGGRMYPLNQDAHAQLNAVNTLKRHLGGAMPLTRTRFDFDLVVLFDLSKVGDRFDVPPEANVHGWMDLNLLPSTTSPSTPLDERAVSILESRQQRDAIMLSRDFRSAMETLVDEEQFSYYDLTKAIGVTRAMLSQWRDRPLEKVRKASHARMGRLLFAWKYWLHVTEGDMLGRYLRHVPEGSTASLLDILPSNHVPTEEEIATLIDRLARHAAHDRKSGVRRRRDVGGLPQGPYSRDLILD